MFGFIVNTVAERSLFETNTILETPVRFSVLPWQPSNTERPQVTVSSTGFGL